MPARVRIQSCRVFFFNDTATTEIYTLSLHDALPIYTEIHRVIGLIGGMSWESSAEYYRLINQGVRDRLGPLRSAKLLMYSVDFGPIEQAQHEGRWDDAAALLEDAARRLQQGGADGVLLCTNTMHKLADRIAAAVRIPFLHIRSEERRVGK